MLEQLKQKISQLNFREHQKFLVVAVAAVLITAVIVFFMWRSSQNYVALFGAQEEIPTAQVVEALTTDSIDYRIDPNSGQLLVLESELSKARILLVGKGIKVVVPTGYELMDQEAMLGSSQFVQNVRYKRSLEGELAQSVMALDPVAYARVHLGISESSSFVVNNKPDSTASVIVRLRTGQQLTDEQIGAIIQLVAGSVPGLRTDKVQVVDQEGHLLSERYQADSAGLLSMRNGADLVGRIQHDVEKNVSSILGPLVGINNYRVSVMPRLDLSRVEETQERYGKDPKLTSENINQENLSDEVAQGVPGALSNRPASQSAPGAPTQTSRNQADRKYNYDRDIRHIQHAGFKVEKLSIAIILNRNAPGLEGWSDEQLAELKKLVMDAAGVETERGDSLSLSMLSFSPIPIHEEPDLEWWQDPFVMYWAEVGGAGFLALLLLLFGVLPLLRRLGKPNVATRDKVKDVSLMTDDGHNGETESDEQVMRNMELPDSFQKEVNLPPQSSGLETKVEYLQLLIETETERVAEVIKQWINSNERSSSAKSEATPAESPSQPE